MTTIRFALWAAVSTKAQAAPDKISLPEQESRCRAAALARGWQESAGPYVVSGESRTRWIDLRDATEAISELRAMLNAARRGRYDVLVIWDFDRLRELLDPVSRTLTAYGIQLYSVSQPVDPQNPETYDPYAEDTPWLMQDVNRIASRLEISKLRRKYKEGMPARVRDRGLPAISIPFGYRKPPGHEADSAVTPEKDPTCIPFLLTLKDLLLAGRSLPQLVKFAEGTGIHPPRARQWYAQTIRDILRNPFYAGYNRWGLSKNFTDPLTGRRLRNRDIPAKATIVHKGLHDPLWDDQTHAAIIAELDRRGHSYRGKSATQLSRMLACATCKATLWMQHNGPRTEPDRAIWRCSKDPAHAHIVHTRAMKDLSAILQDQFRIHATPDDLPESKIPAIIPARLSEIEDLKTRRERLEAAYLAGGFKMDSYLKNASALDDQLEKAEHKLQTAQQEAAASAEVAQTWNTLATIIQGVPDWLERRDQQELNRILHLLFTEILIGEEKITKVTFRP